MSEEHVVEKLSQGWELVNRGTGWWISEPRIPYRRTESHQIEDSVVSSLIKSNRITLEMPYKALWARLAEPKPSTPSGKDLSHD
jgi:hypothetical protein